LQFWIHQSRKPPLTQRAQWWGTSRSNKRSNKYSDTVFGCKLTSIRTNK